MCSTPGLRTVKGPSRCTWRSSCSRSRTTAGYSPADFCNDEPYSIDRLSDGTRVVLDSVGSQANRMEPMFRHPPFAELVPQVEIRVGKDAESQMEVSLLEVGHRLGDVVLHESANPD
ncbi:MAG: type I-U CRISPR-associated RAMP protein Csb1/Cas7u [Myxococcota bacterium]